MRIITGSAKGLKLKTPKGLAVRPTGDRVKESVFNILADRVIDATVADFFAGTGNLGIEALSRGASGAVFVDNSQASVSLLRANVALARLVDRAEIHKADVSAAISRLAQAGRRFDLIFCDPPYNRGYVAAVLQQIAARDLLSPDGLIIIEHSQHEMIPDDLSSLHIVRSQRYGETMVSFLTRSRE